MNFRWSGPNRSSGIHEDIQLDPDWVRTRDEQIDREIYEQEILIDREIREREIRESEQHYEAQAKRHSRFRAQLSYENPYDPAQEAEEVGYVVTDEYEGPQPQPQQPPIEQNLMGVKQKSTSHKKKSPRSPRKSRPPPTASEATAASTGSAVTSPQTEDKSRQKPKEKRGHGRKHATSESGKGGASSSRPSRGRHDSTRKSIRRQDKIHDDTTTGGSGSKKGRSDRAGPGAGEGGAISGADLSDVFDEEQHQYYPDEAEAMKYMEDRSNCRKK